jgi:hypothetical protein
MAERDDQSSATEPKTGSVLGLDNYAGAQDQGEIDTDTSAKIGPRERDEFDAQSRPESREGRSRYPSETGGGVTGGTRDDGFEGGGDVRMGGRDPKVRRQP